MSTLHGFHTVGTAARASAREDLESGWKQRWKVERPVEDDLERQLQRELTQARGRERALRPGGYFRAKGSERLAFVENYTRDHFRTGVRPAPNEGLLFAAAPSVGEWQPCLAALRANRDCIDEWEMVLMDSAVASMEDWPLLEFGDAAEALTVRYTGGSAGAELFTFTLENTTTRAKWDLGCETRAEAKEWVKRIGLVIQFSRVARATAEAHGATKAVDYAKVTALMQRAKTTDREIRSGRSPRAPGASRSPFRDGGPRRSSPARGRSSSASPKHRANAVDPFALD